MHRPNLNDLSPGDQTHLAEMIQQYVTPEIVGQHNPPPPGVHDNGSMFLSWHRVYLAGLENFLVEQGHPEWSPLPAWNPAESIPHEFNIPNQGPFALENLDPNISFSPEFDPENLGNFENDEELGMELMLSPFHNSVHNAVGGGHGYLQVARGANLLALAQLHRRHLVDVAEINRHHTKLLGIDARPGAPIAHQRRTRRRTDNQATRSWYPARSSRCHRPGSGYW